MVKKFERLKRTVLRKSNILEYCNDTLKLPNGNIREYDMMVHKGAAAVVPVMDDGGILMVRQYRPAIDRVTLEIPAGGRDSTDEPYEAAARRELEEETGYRAGKMTHLITIDTAIAYCDERIEVFLAEKLTKTKQHLDEDEFIEYCVCRLPDLVAMIGRGEIRDSKTISSILAMEHYCTNAGDKNWGRNA